MHQRLALMTSILWIFYCLRLLACRRTNMSYAQPCWRAEAPRRAQIRWSVECEGCSVKCGAWRVQCEVWSVECEESNEKWEVWSVDCEVWSVECEVWIGESAVWSEKCEVLTAKGAVWSVKTVKCQVWSGASHVTCEAGHNFRRVHARTGLAGARRMQVL